MSCPVLRVFFALLRLLPVFLAVSSPVPAVQPTRPHLTSAPLTSPLTSHLCPFTSALSPLPSALSTPTSCDAAAARDRRPPWLPLKQHHTTPHDDGDDDTLSSLSSHVSPLPTSTANTYPPTHMQPYARLHAAGGAAVSMPCLPAYSTTLRCSPRPPEPAPLCYCHYRRRCPCRCRYRCRCRCRRGP
jgi:hypothetical protein